MKKEKRRKSGFRIFPVEQRKKVVARLDLGEITRNEAMEEYGISEPETLRSWILRYSANPDKILRKVYSKAKKRQIAFRLISGETTSKQLAQELDVDPSALRRWVRDVKAETGYSVTKESASALKMASESEKVEELQLKVAALNMMIDIAEKELGIDIRKKSGTKQ